VESVKHLLWHGNVDEALERLGSLFMDLDLIRKRSAAAEKLAAGVAEFETYIGNNRESIPNFGERYRQGETISTAFVESTINQVVSRRFVKKQQMQWTLRGGALVVTDPNEGPQRRTGRGVPALVPEIPPAIANDGTRAEGVLTPGLLLHS